MFLYVDRSTDTAKSAMAPRRLRRRGVVLHETIGTSSLAWLQRDEPVPGDRSSADYLVARDGTIFQITLPSWHSYHSGRARWRLYQEDDFTINQGFVGVELENYPPAGEVIVGAQYIALGALLRQLLTYHALDSRNVCGHYECALPPGRKQDPSSLNWGMLTAELINPSNEQRAYRFPRTMP